MFTRNRRWLFTGSLLTLLFFCLTAYSYGASPIHIVVNGKVLDIPTKETPILVNGRVMVPARYVAEALGATVSWNNLIPAVVINSEAKNDSNSEPTRLGSSYLTNGRDIWVPFHSIQQCFGAGTDTESIGENKYVITFGKNKIEFELGNGTAKANGESISIPSAFIVQGMVYVPVKMFQPFGVRAHIDGDTCVLQRN
ncbi:hypothetical protein GTO91_06570 [Heliobacterium undosum]|uniref:Copper amine oxidase-like N-terminal domain-containing protein n=1 Tax=Heliomicrobium undosum TaxID=121734 RepID=A0A845KZA4_9FIRM|nr:copper amine oxidase N-terminal domain-containing protein [Heliomicrobium undosum]MZP29367.1 hypothetical protein [Heliomicrobium undosum]